VQVHLSCRLSREHHAESVVVLAEQVLLALGVDEAARAEVGRAATRACGTARGGAHLQLTVDVQGTSRLIEVREGGPDGPALARVVGSGPAA
jgi:hypothetical protein